MIPGINPRDMERAMKKLGITQEIIDAEEVIIKTPDKNILIKNPQVAKVNMMGQETFQITGDIQEQKKEIFSKEDIKVVMQQAQVSEEKAKQALEKEGDIAAAILALKHNKT